MILEKDFYPHSLEKIFNPYKVYIHIGMYVHEKISIPLKN